MKECKYYVLAIDNGTYKTHIKVECPRDYCTIEVQGKGICDIVQGETREVGQGLQLISLYKINEEL